MRNRILGKLNNSKGMTMVEVLVGFVILLIIMTGIYHMIRFGSNMLYEAIDMRQGQEEFEEAVYKNTPDSSIVTESPDEGASFELHPVETGNSAVTINLGNELKLFSYESTGALADKLRIKIYGIKRE